MFHPLPVFIALRYSMSRNHNGFISFINFFSITGTALGVLALIVVTSVMNGFENELKQRILGIVPHVLLSSPDAELLDWKTMANKLQGYPSVKHVSPIVESEALIQSSSQIKGVMMQGISPDHDMQHSVIADNMLTGHLGYLSAGAYRIIISRSLASQLSVSVGSEVRLMLTESSTYSPFGVIPAQRLFTVAGIFQVGSEMDDKVALVNIDDAARLLKMPANSISAIRLFLHDAFAADELTSVLTDDFPDFDVNNWRKTQGKLFAAVKMEKTLMATLLTLIVAVAIFNIVSALVMLINDKKSDVAILQSLGLPRDRVSQIFMLNGFYNGLFGALIGMFLGILIATFLNQILTLLGIHLLAGLADGLPVMIENLQVFLIVIGAILLSFLATLYPAWYVSTIKPAEALREE